MNYYNENDPKAAAWLRELIKANLIAQGEVDERSIEDIRPADLAPYTQCHFYAGIGGWSYALRLAGWPDDKRVWTGSCPCQPFSAAGKGGGFADKRHLWPAWFHLIKQCCPSTIFGEQVASALDWLDVVQNDLENTGYAVGSADLCAASVGAPHIRQRLYFVADARYEQRRRGPSETSNGQGSPRIESERLRVTSELADSASGNARAERQQRSGQHGLQPEGSEARGMVNTNGKRKIPIPRILQREKPESNGVISDGGVVTPASEQMGVPRCAWESRGASFWSDCDWIDCQDGKQRPVEPGAQRVANGISEKLADVLSSVVVEIEEELNAAPMQANYRKEVCLLWETLLASTQFEWANGRLHGVQQAPILLAFMRELANKGWSIAQCIPCAGEEETQIAMRMLQRNEKPSCPSCGRGLAEQCGKQPPNAMHFLSSVLARHAQATWGEAFDANARATFPLIVGGVGRAAALRGYGNAIVPQVAAEFIKAYMSL